MIVDENIELAVGQPVGWGQVYDHPVTARGLHGYRLYNGGVNEAGIQLKYCK